MPIPYRTCLVPLLVATLAGCASWQPDGGAPDARASESGTCHAQAVQWAVGQPGTAEVSERVWRESHAGLIRPLRPEQVTGASTRPDRITIELDADNVIRRVYCG